MDEVQTITEEARRTILDIRKKDPACEGTALLRRTVQTLLDNGVIAAPQVELDYGGDRPWSLLTLLERSRYLSDLLFFATYIGPLVIGMFAASLVETEFLRGHRDD